MMRATATKPQDCSPGRRCGPALALLFLLAAAVFPCPARGQAPAGRPALVVVCDDNYPPYAFRDATGAVRGILPDQWALWEKKSGVRVDFRAMDWAAAQRVMRDGQADVIDTIFLTEERARRLDFTPAYATIKVPVYVHQALGGIGDLPSLKGFTVGVKAGDAVIGHLARRGIDSLREYPSYEAIILAAKNQEIKVFSVDQPAAVHFLYKHGLAGEFREAFVLYTGEFHRAVRKGRPELLRLVQDGFNRISPDELQAIDRKWLGSPLLFTEILRQWRPWLLWGIAVMLALAAGNVLLTRRVRTRTAELHTALDELRQSLVARQQSETALATTLERYNLLARQTGIVTWEVDLQGLYLGLGSAVLKTAHYQPEELTHKRYAYELHPEAGRDAFKAKLLAILAKGEPFQDLVHPVMTGDGGIAWFVSSGIPTHDAQGNLRGAWGTSTDITARRRAEEALQENHELISLFMRHSPIYTFIKEVTAGESRVVMASDNFRQMIGIPGADMQGKTMAELFAPEFAAKITADDWSVVTRGEVLKLEEELDGRHYTTIKFPIVRGGKTLLAGYTIDISDRKQVEAEREKLIAELRRALDEVKTLRGLLPICANCKKVRDDQGFWQQVEHYVGDRTEAQFTHGICPDCARRLYPELQGRLLSEHQ